MPYSTSRILPNTLAFKMKYYQNNYHGLPQKHEAAQLFIDNNNNKKCFLSSKTAD